MGKKILNYADLISEHGSEAGLLTWIILSEPSTSATLWILRFTNRFVVSSNQHTLPNLLGYAAELARIRCRTCSDTLPNLLGYAEHPS
jgi:hypothetical protein